MEHSSSSSPPLSSGATQYSSASIADPVAQAALQALNAELTAQRQQIAALLQQQQVAAAAAASSVAATTPSSSSAMPSDPTAAAIASAFAMLGRSMALSRQLPPFPRFGSDGNTHGAAAHRWIKEMETAFEAANASAPGGFVDEEKIRLAIGALEGSAQEWGRGMHPKPTTWKEFRDRFLEFYQPAGSRRLIEQQLHELPAKASRMKLTTAGLQAYTTKFLELANQIPESDMIDRSKIMLYAKGIPASLRMIIEKADDEAHRPGGKPMELQRIAHAVVNRTALQETVYHGSGSPSSSHLGDAMDLSAVTLCQQTFGVPREVALSYCAPAEGWAAHDTSASPSFSPSATSPAAATSLSALTNQIAELQRQLAATAAAAAAGPADLNALSRRTTAPGVKKEIPDALAKERRDAGLCIKCGVTAYGAGAHGHNSRTCKLPIDKTTSIAEGLRRAKAAPKSDF